MKRKNVLNYSGFVSTAPACREISNYLYLIVGLDELLKAHLLLQIEAELLQTTEDAVVIRCLGTLLFPTAICWAGAGLSRSQGNFSLCKTMNHGYAIKKKKRGEAQMSFF